MATRRAFLAAGLGTLAFPHLGRAVTQEVRLISPASRGGEHFVAHLPRSHADPQLGRMPMRGHGLVLDPRRSDEALIVGRRPGTAIVKVNLASGRLLNQWDAEEDHYFAGHAVYSAQGDVIFTTEDDSASGQGIVAVREAKTLRVLDTYATHGIGPHELLMMPDGLTLAVANGGIRTLPETGRVKLNRGRIETSLVYLDSRNGKLLGKHVVPSTQQSLRHLAVTADGRVAAALQYEGDKSRRNVPLLMFHSFHSVDAPLSYASAPDAAWSRMRHYAASVAYDATHDRFALTCPLGNTLALWSGAGEYVGAIDVPKVSGVAFHRGTGYASNELGEIYEFDCVNLNAVRIRQIPGLQWDNHLYLMRA